MLIRPLQRFPNIKSALAQPLLETHSFQGPDVSFVSSTVIKSIGILLYTAHA